MLNQLIQQAKDRQVLLNALQSEQNVFLTPTLSDTAQLPAIYAEIQQQMIGEHIQDIRMCFVFIAVYLYSPASIYDKYPLKVGLRQRLGLLIGRSKAEVSKTFTSAKLHYEKISRFREKIDAIMGSLSVFC